jgi:hypothetical protein
MSVVIVICILSALFFAFVMMLVSMIEMIIYSYKIKKSSRNTYTDSSNFPKRVKELKEKQKHLNILQTFVVFFAASRP